MYTKETLKEIGITPKRSINGVIGHNPDYAVLTADTELGLIQLKNKVYEHFGVGEENIPEKPEEYDIPWFIQDEFLNYEYIKDGETHIIKSIKNGNRGEVL